MKNLILAALATVMSGSAALANSYVVVENDFVLLNQDLPDLAVSTAGVGYSTNLTDRILGYGEISAGALYNSQDNAAVLKLEAGMRGALTDNLMIEGDVQYLDNLESDLSAVQINTKARLFF